MVKVYLIRHAQSTRNAYGSIERNVPLTEFGKEQAKKLGGWVHTVICSPLRRAVETLAHSNLKYCSIIYSDLCRELMDGEEPNYLEREDLISETNKDIENRINKLKLLVTELHDQGIKHIAILSHSFFIYRLANISMHNCQLVEYDL